MNCLRLTLLCCGISLIFYSNAQKNNVKIPSEKIWPAI